MRLKRNKMLKRVAAIILSATVAVTGVPYTEGMAYATEIIEENKLLSESYESEAYESEVYESETSESDIETETVVETEAVIEVSKLNGTVIATGGGAVLKKENTDALRQNGKLFFLNRPLDDIIPTGDRPLSSNYEALKKLFEERYEIYVSSADEEIYVDGDINNTVNRVLESL
ncbi:MAG: hypothetical protein II273_08140 [Lachnospiraceae bacterium]|nr:hypothetical protein [Lachnospiraceae bacterium]